MMIFKVSDECKGGLVLRSLGGILKAGVFVSVDPDKVILPDVRAAIAHKVLVPVNEKEYQEKYQKVKSEVIVVNMTKKIMVLGNSVLKSGASIVVDRSFLELADVVSARKAGYVVVVEDKKEIRAAKMKQATINQPKKQEAEPKMIEKTSPARGEDRHVKPQVWDFREKKAVDATPVPKSEDVTIVGEQTETKKTKRVVSKKRKEKKGKGGKIKKDNIIKPVGEQRLEKTSVEAQVDLDSRGQPVRKVGDAIADIVKSITGNDISFVDEEQQVERLKQRKNI